MENIILDEQRLSEHERALLREAEDGIQAGLRQVWMKLKLIHDLRLYREQYDSFDAYCVARWQHSRQWGYQQVEAGRVCEAIERQVSTNGLQLPLPTSERQVRPMFPLDDVQIIETWQRAVEKAGGGVPSGSLVEQVIKEIAAATEPLGIEEPGEVRQDVTSPRTSLADPSAEDITLDSVEPEPDTATLSVLASMTSALDETALFRRMALLCEDMAEPLGIMRAQKVGEAVLSTLLLLAAQQKLMNGSSMNKIMRYLPAAPRLLLLPPPPLQGEAQGYVPRHIRVKNGSIIIKQEDIDSETTRLIKGVPGRTYDPKQQQWSAPMSSAAHALALAQNFDFFISWQDEEALLGAANLSREQRDEGKRKRQSTAAEKEARREEQERERQDRQRARYDASFATDADIEVPGLGGELYAYQRAGVKYLLDAKRAILGDEMGLGKTPEALAALQAANAYPALVVCPATVRPNWRKEAEKWLPGRSICYLKDGRAKVTDADITIINYDLLGKHLDKLLEVDWRAIVADESHFIKNHKAQRTEYLLRLADRTQYRFLLSGTAITSKPIELVSQLRAIGALDGAFGGFSEFAERYTAGRRSYYEGARNLKELNIKLRQNCYVRRLKRDVLASLPVKRRLTQWVDIDTIHEYDTAETNLVAYVRERAQRDISFLASIAHLDKEEQHKAKKAHAEDVGERATRGEMLVMIGKLRQIAGRGKIAAAKAWIEEYLNQVGAKLVLFAWHQEVINEIAEAFHAPRITGDVGAEERQKVVERFQNDPSCPLVVCNIRSGGQGITLTAASTTCFVELDWTPAMLRQAEDRIHRIGQEAKAVENYYLLADVSIDRYMGGLIAEKAEIVDATLDGVREGEEGDNFGAGGFVDWLMEQAESTDQH